MIECSGRGVDVVKPLILCASTQYWEETWFRKQHFMAHLARRRPVGYIEPSYSILRAPSHHVPETGRNEPFRMKVRRAGDSLWVLTPPRGIPLLDAAAGERHTSTGTTVDCCGARRSRLGFDRVWLWLYNPLYVQSVPTLAPERVIFDLVDDMGAYAARASSRRNMQACVERAIETADLVTRDLARPRRHLRVAHTDG